jgi:mannosyl-3-phosphoglycerate phosphatase
MKKDSPQVNDRGIILIFTDLDGTLLDHVSYKWEKAKPALDLCKEMGIPVIMVSSKTRAELEILAQDIGLPYPFISENGGGIFFPKGRQGKVPPGTILAKKYWKLSIGTHYEQLVKNLREIRDELGWPIRGFSDMSLGEISGLTGLDPGGARLASLREYDEPFIIQHRKDPDIEKIRFAARKRGLRITKGGRFYHLHGRNDKGEAVRILIAWYRETFDGAFTIALGDSQNDFSMLKQADQPVLILSQQRFAGIEKEIPGLMISQGPGPEAWNSVIMDILNKKI